VGSVCLSKEGAYAHVLDELGTSVSGIEVFGSCPFSILPFPLIRVISVALGLKLCQT